jgi:hypothetical protein
VVRVVGLRVIDALAVAAFLNTGDGSLGLSASRVQRPAWSMARSRIVAVLPGQGRS